MKRTLNLFMLAAFICVALLAGLWPFEFNPPNGAIFSPVQNEIIFKDTGIAYLDNLRGMKDTKRLHLAILPSPAQNPGASTILSFHDEKGGDVAALSQWGKSLILRTYSKDGYFKKSYREKGLMDILENGPRTLIDIELGPHGIRMEVKGRYSSTVVSAGEDLLERVYGLTLGSSPGGRYCWAGSARDIRINGDAAQFTIPEIFHPLFRTVLEWPFRDQVHRWKASRDMVLNFLGFMPLGLIVGLGLRGRFGMCAVVALAAGFAISLFIETVQVYMPSRFSSLSDLALNTLGSVAGAFAARFLIAGFTPSGRSF